MCLDAVAFDEIPCRQIIHHMWKTRDTLLAELAARDMSDASNVTKPAYQDLINTSQPWWELLSLFKLRNLRRGLDLVVPKQFSPSENDPGPGPAANHEEVPSGSSGVDEDSQTSPLHRSTDGTFERGAMRLSEKLRETRALASAVTGEAPHSDAWDQETEDESSTPPPGKRRRLSPGRNTTLAPIRDNDQGSLFPSTRGAASPACEGSNQSLRSYSRVLGQVQTLEGAISGLCAAEISALEELLRQVNGLHGTNCMARVLDTINEHLPVSVSVATPPAALHSYLHCRTWSGEPSKLMR